MKWEPNRRSEQYYQRRLRWLFDKAISAALGKDYDAIVQNVLGITSSKTFLNFAKKFALSMLFTTNNNTFKTWKEAVLKSTRTQQLYRTRQFEIEGALHDQLEMLMKENVSYIKSQPFDIAQRIVDLTTKYTQEGKRPEEIRAALMKQYPSMTKAKATLIARTEASKAANNLIQVRAQKLGCTAYIWHTSKDQRVRQSHGHMDDVIVFYNNPPSPEALIGVKSTLGAYHAGLAPNCRCYQQPVIDLDVVSFPHKVFWNGSIVSMTRKQFERVM